MGAKKPHSAGKRPVRNSRPVTRIRRICLALPGATETEAWGAPTFRVRDKLFAMYADDVHGDGRTAVWLNSDAATQQQLVASDPERFFSPPYVGCNGWIGIRLDRGLDWDIVAEFICQAYLRTAPKRLAAVLEEQDG